MSSESAEIAQILKCQHCSQPYDGYHPPRILPCCNKSVCHLCITKLETSINRSETTFECVICGEDFEIPSKGLPVNEELDKLILESPTEIEPPKNNEVLKSEKELSKLENFISKFIFEMENGDHLIKEDCDELKREVQLAKEELILEVERLSETIKYMKSNKEGIILKIEEKAELLMSQISQFEKNSIQNYSQIILASTKKENDQIESSEEMLLLKYKAIEKAKQQAKVLINLVNYYIQQLRTFLNQLSLDEKVPKAFSEKVNELKAKIDTEKKNFKKSIFDNHLLKFEANTTSIDENLLGTIIPGKFEFDKLLYAYSNTVRLLDLNTGECLKTFLEHSSLVSNVKFLNESKIATCSWDKTIKIWDISTGYCIKTLIGHSRFVYGIVVLSNDRIASCSDDAAVRIWEVKSGRCIHILNGHTEGIKSIAKLSNEGLLSGSLDTQIKLWNINSGQCLKTFIGHMGPVTCLERLSDERILSGSYDKTIKLWNVENGDCLSTLSGHNYNVNCIRALSDERIISGSENQTLRVWCLKTCRCIKTINAHSVDVSEIQVLSNEKVISSSQDKTIRIWDLISAKCIKTFQGEDSIKSIDIF